MLRGTDDKLANDPGFLKNIDIALDPLQNCEVLAVLGNQTSAMLAPGETITIIVLVALDRRLFSTAISRNRKENDRTAASLSWKRPTSDVLGEELMNQLLGKFKRG